MGGKFWFKAATNRKNRQNVTYKRSINLTPYLELYRQEKDLSRFMPFGCLAYMYVHKDRCEKGKTAPRAMQVTARDAGIRWLCNGYQHERISGLQPGESVVSDKLLVWFLTNHSFLQGRRASSSSLTRWTTTLTFYSRSHLPIDSHHVACI